MGGGGCPIRTHTHVHRYLANHAAMSNYCIPCSIAVFSVECGTMAKFEIASTSASSVRAGRALAACVLYDTCSCSYLDDNGRSCGRHRHRHDGTRKCAKRESFNRRREQLGDASHSLGRSSAALQMPLIRPLNDADWSAYTWWPASLMN